ncbi:hypothetical protein [Flagellimonas allohymeniacidonis]|uniref:DUF4440 domain-containing protein n=1 Tax=Flagellimonas allohymeniacidonis TaxID=2517819 RepID=A0A4Q8QGS0_9FLAO|nr:hypothetical protein [Allomuricauda hymeniacidonis]TAI49691.1 hypothetical protein EW142_07810 [Allomuricauda hymeniacidonis]
MKNVLFLVIILGGIFMARSQKVAKIDSIQIVGKVDDWNKAWKIKDVDLATKWYSDDADFTNAFGFSMIGKTAINSYLSKVFKMDFVMSGDSEQTSLKLKYINETTVLVISTISRIGQKLSDNSELGPRKTTHYRLFQKSDDWEITAHLISDARSIATNKH